MEAALELWPAVDPGARPRKGDPVTLTLRASAAAAHAGETHRAVSLTRAALARAGSDADSELAARVRYTLAGNLMRVDSLKAAFTYSSEALAMIPAEPPSHTWVWAAATHVMAARYMGHDEDAERVARQALRTAEELRLADAQADLIISLVGLEDHNRRTAEGRERLREARDLARRAGNVSVEMRALFNLAIGAYESGALDECLTWLAEGLERANRSGLVSSPVRAGAALPPVPDPLHPGPLGRVRAGGRRRRRTAATGGRLRRRARVVRRPGTRRGRGRRAGPRAARRTVRLDGHTRRGHRADRRRRPARRPRGRRRLRTCDARIAQRRLRQRAARHRCAARGAGSVGGRGRRRRAASDRRRGGRPALGWHLATQLVEVARSTAAKGEDG